MMWFEFNKVAHTKAIVIASSHNKLPKPIQTFPLGKMCWHYPVKHRSFFTGQFVDSKNEKTEA